MKTEKPKEPDALEAEMHRLIRKIESENKALNKILKNPGSAKKAK